MILIFSKYFYLVSLSSYYTFYLISKFHVSIQSAQLYLFVFLLSVAARNIHRRPGRRPYWTCKYVIWVSILGVAPFTLILPHVGLAWTAVLIGRDRAWCLSSAFTAILVFAQELVPGKVGMIAGVVLWPGFWNGRVGIRRVGTSGGQDQHRICL